ncbi:hypothetical protein SAMD00019534_090010, partial [Acytostelium subglobosum LB1]|uniref:hypothetical protein n=1 Tax=Acytostelium subglobosum LB1 TaxID=1410327 RepID=UPI000644B098
TRMTLPRLLLSLLLLLSVITTSTTISAAADSNSNNNNNNEQSFNEEMVIKPLVNGKLYTHVQFTTKWSANFYDQSTFQHYDLFSRSIGDLITRVGVEEMTLQFTQGRWNYADWGNPVRSAPVGVELMTWLRPLDNTDIDAQWRDLTHSLSGLFCASMQFLYQVPHHTSVPARSFRPEGQSNIYHQQSTATSPAILSLSDNRTTPLQLRYGILPRESVCTENLTPWVKLLPCREQAGLGRLLNPLRLYDVHYHSMSITVRKTCDSDQGTCVNPTLEIIQSISVVHDVRQKDPLIDQSKPKDKVDVDIEQLFGVKGGLSACPLASSSKIYVVNKPYEQNNQLVLTPKPSLATDGFLIYDLIADYSAKSSLKLQLQWSRFTKNPTPAPITAHSHLTGYGQERGGIAIQIYNNHNLPINITYFQAIPWYLRVYFHTFKFNINNERKFEDQGSINQ